MRIWHVIRKAKQRSFFGIGHCGTSPDRSFQSPAFIAVTSCWTAEPVVHLSTPLRRRESAPVGPKMR